jgi:hypothetical protein
VDLSGSILPKDCHTLFDDSARNQKICAPVFKSVVRVFGSWSILVHIWIIFPGTVMMIVSGSRQTAM